MTVTTRLPALAHLLFLLTLLAHIPPTSSLRFYLQDRERRCFKFDAPFTTRVIGERSIANGPGDAELSIEVKDNNANTVYQSHSSHPNENKFSFVTPDSAKPALDTLDIDDYDYSDFADYDAHGAYHVCLTLTLDPAVHKTGKRAVTFWIRPDTSAPEHQSAKHATEHAMSSITASLQTMHSVLQQIISDLSALQQRERRLVKRSNNTAKRLSLLSILALVVLVFTAACQYLFFKKFFKSKKLL